MVRNAAPLGSLGAVPRFSQPPLASSPKPNASNKMHFVKRDSPNLIVLKLIIMKLNLLKLNLLWLNLLKLDLLKLNVLKLNT